LWDIAEELQVEPSMVQFAYDYYKENDMLFTDEKNIL